MLSGQSVTVNPHIRPHLIAQGSMCSGGEHRAGTGQAGLERSPCPSLLCVLG